MIQLQTATGHRLWIPDICNGESMAIANSILDGDEYRIRDLRRAHHWPVYFVDVGAHFGAFGLAVAATFPGAHVAWLEPYPPAADCCRRNLAAQPIHRHAFRGAAVNDDAREAVLQVYSNHLSGNHMAGAWTPDDPNPGTPASLTVPSRRLSELLVDWEFPRIDVLKLDCEASEDAVLADLAAAGWLRRTRWVRWEWHGRDHLDRCLALLAQTHIAAADCRPGQTHGFALAHHRLDA